MDPITIAMLGAGLTKTVYGFVQDSKANKIRKNNIRPDYEIPDEYFQNLSMYEELAQGGMPEDELVRQHQQALRGLSASLSTGMQLGADANTVNDCYQSYLNQMGDLGVKNAQIQFSNINNLANSRQQLAEQKFIEFSYDKDQPYKDKAQLASAMKQQATQNIFGGLDTMMAGVAGGQSRQLYKDQTDALNRSLTTVNPNSGTDMLGGRTSFIDNPGAIGNRGAFSEVALQIAARQLGQNAANRQNIVDRANHDNYYWQRLLDGNNSWWWKQGERK